MPRIAKSKRDNQQKWEDRISRAKKVRKSWKDLFRVDMVREYLDGKQNPGYPADEWITINKIYSHLKATLPSLYSADPYFYVRLRTSYNPAPMMIALYEDKAKIRQSMLNYLKEELDLKNKARLCVLDGQIAYGVAKVHYHADQKENPEAGSLIYGTNEEPLFNDTGEPLLQPETIPINERYCISRIHPDDFLWDEDAGPLEDTWNWLAQRIRMTLEEAQGNPQFSSQAVKWLEGKGETKGEEEKARESRKKGDILGPAEREGKRRKQEQKEPELIVVWEIYDIKNKTWTCIAEGGEIPLIDEEPLPPGVEKHPFSVLRFTLRDDSPYPHPPLSPGIDPQREFNLARSRILTHRKRYARKYEVFETALSDESELSKLESGEDGALIRKNQPLPVVTPIQDAPLDQMGYLEIGYLDKDMIELLGGQHDEARGIAGAESATQAAVLDKRLEMKEGDSLSMVVEFVQIIARKLDQLVQANITREQAVRITGPQGEYWEIIKPDDFQAIEGEFEYSVNVGATMPRLPQVERTSWMAFLGLLANFPHLLLAKHLLKRIAEMHHIEDESMIEEIYQLGQKIMGGQLPMPGATGSQPNVAEANPQAAVGGQQGGPASLMLPGAGNFSQGNPIV